MDAVLPHFENPANTHSNLSTDLQYNVVYYIHVIIGKLNIQQFLQKVKLVVYKQEYIIYSRDILCTLGIN